MKRYLFPLLLLLSLAGGCRHAATTSSRPEIRFTDSILLPATAVKNQARTGSCWAFGVVSLLESELLRDTGRQGEDTYPDLSEMWLVRHAWFEKAVKYVRTRGRCDFSQGGELSDVPYLVRRYGIVPQSVYEGNSADGEYDHARLERAVHRCARQIVKRRLYRTPGWEQRLQTLLDDELGVCPERFRFNGVEYTPESYRDSIGLGAARYMNFTSFLHHPFYTLFVAEFPDNWLGESSVNVPLDSLMSLLGEALRRGYSVGWCGNVTDRGFNAYRGVAGVSRDDSTTQRSRQQAFDTQELRDGHILHIVGVARRDDGRIFYKAKNSWGRKNLRGGYVYLSENYIRKNTVALLVNRNAVRQELLAACDIGQ